MRLSTERFSDRVADYVRYRPHYPAALIDILANETGLTSTSVIADIGSGTGILSELFLAHGNPVFGVEPNREMREAGAQLLGRFPHFLSIAGTAETTTLEPVSVDFVTAGQAFHWFDLEGSRTEFRRILRRGGWVVLIWNERREGTLFGREYREILRRFATDYNRVNQKLVTGEILNQFFEKGFATASVPNSQEFDFDGLMGRLLSSSYTPKPDHPLYPPMRREVEALFARFAHGDRVTFEYDTNLYYGRFTD